MGPRSSGNKATSCTVRRSIRTKSFPVLGTAVTVTVTVACIATPFEVTLAQEDFAGVDSNDAFIETGPQNLPGHEKGARDKTGEAEPTERVVSADAESWFNWEYATGDWNGKRTELLEKGIDVQGSYTFDWSSVFDGGLEDKDATQSLLDFNITFDLEQIFELQGATFFLDFYSTSGTGISGYAGDFQGMSNIETDRSVDILAEVWWEQWLFDDFLRFKIGKVDANSEFAFVDVAGDFINSSPGVSPAIFTIPTYPDPATSINLFLYPEENWYLGFGVYDGAAAVDGVPTGTRGLKSFFNDDLSDDYFLIGEAGCNYENLSDLGPGRFALGVWHHTGEFATFAGGTDEGTEGFYALIEQQLWQADPDSESGASLWGFGEYGYSDDEVSEVGNHFIGGLILNSPFAGRPHDALGGMVSFVDLSDEAGAGFPDDETAFELFYKFQLTPFASIKPDLQFISNPSGDPTLDDAVVGTLRFEIAF